MGRNPYYWPGDPKNPFNYPIGTGAVYVNAKLPARTQAACGQELIAINMDTSQPSVNVYQNAGQHDCNRCVMHAASPGCPASPGIFSPTINIPYNQSLIIPSSNLNYPGAFTDSSNNRWEAGNFAHCTNGGIVTAGHMSNFGTITDASATGASGGSKLSTLYGTIRYGEFTNGTNGTGDGYIRHVLRFNLNGKTDLSSAGSGFRWPATGADGGYSQPSSPNYYGGSVPQSVQGSLYAIPQSINLNSLGLATVPGKRMAWTFQNYGGYVCNDSVAPVWPICIETSAVGNVTDEFFALFGFKFQEKPNANLWAIDMAIIFANLYVVDNNSATNIGGGGTPLQPFAPPFGATLNPPFLQQVNGNTTASSSTLTVANAKTTVGSALGLMVGVRAPAAAVTPTQVGSSWTNPAQSGSGNSTVVLNSHSTTAGNFVTVAALNRVAGVGAIASVTDNASPPNTYAQLTNAFAQSTTNLRLEMWGGHQTNVGTVITVTFAGTGAGSAIASEWHGLSESLDVAVVSNNGMVSPASTGSSAQTVTASDLCIAAYGAVGSITFSGENFTPNGTTLNVPDLNNQATGIDNCILEVSEMISGASGIAQSFASAMSSNSGWAALMVVLSPAASGGSSPTVSISGGGTWVEQESNNTSGLGNASAWTLAPTGAVPANGITINSSSSVGSIEYEFYEIANATCLSVTGTTGSSTSPSVQTTPVNSTDVQVGMIFVPNISATLSPTSVPTWENDAVTQGLASNANSQIVSGGNVSGSMSAQTYNGTLSPSAPWAAFILNFAQLAVPSQVSQPSISPGQSQVSANWNTPNPNGSALTSYIALVYSGVNPDGSGGTLASTITGIAVVDYSIVPYVITGLTNGIAYSVAIEAVNSIGTSLASQRSLAATPFTPSTVPGTPVAPAVVPGDTVATVTITPPATGGVPITGYTFNCYDPYPTLFTTQTQMSDVFTFSGLTDGVTYGFTGIAINGNGSSAESPVTLSTPLGAPATPNAPVCVPGIGLVTVTATAPAPNGSPITEYTFNCYLTLGGQTVAEQLPLFTTTQPGLVYTFSGLQGATPYYFTVIATNAIGPSTESAATVAVPLGSAPPVAGGGTNVNTGTTYQYVYKGKTTLMLYKFSPSQVPSAVLDQHGNLLEYGTYNGETIVWCAQDGEVRRSVKGSPGPTDPYGFGINVSPWESSV
jgi:hypothetical protein